MSVEILYDRLAEEVRWWLEHPDHTITRLATDAGVAYRTIQRIAAGEACSFDVAERILIAVDYPTRGPRRSPVTGRLVAHPLRVRRDPWMPKVRRFHHVNARLSEKQLRQLHLLHLREGLSVRELARRGWRSWGYASEQTALNSILDRWKRLGLAARPKGEATARANVARSKRLPGESVNAYKRRKRRELYERDPAARADAQARIAFVKEHGRWPKAEDLAA